MEVQLLHIKTNKLVTAFISILDKKNLPLRKDNWKFNWQKLYKTEGADFYKISLIESPDTAEGIVMLSLMFEEMVYMNNIEVAPHNVGSSGKFDHVAGALIAYACFKSFITGKNAYKGYLSFESKTALISLYLKKYGAVLASGNKLFIPPENGKVLVEKYLKTT